MEAQIVTYAPDFGEAIEALQRRYIATNPIQRWEMETGADKRKYIA